MKYCHVKYICYAIDTCDLIDETAAEGAWRMGNARSLVFERSGCEKTAIEVLRHGSPVPACPIRLLIFFHDCTV